VRKGGNRVRITAQLIEAKSGAHLWADRFDGSLEDVFDLQDKVAVSVAGIIEPALQRAEMRRSAERPTTDLSAYDLYLRALAVFYPITRERMFEALGLLKQAIGIDRHYGPALSWAAYCHMRLVVDGWAEAPEPNRRKGVDLARQALEAAQDDPSILANAAHVLAYFGEDIGAMIGLVDRALALNPSFARGWYLSGVLRTYAGEHDLGIEHVATSLRLSPRERMGEPMAAMGRAYFFKRRLTRRRRSCSWPFKTIQVFPLGTAISRRAMPIWGDSTKRVRSSPDCARLPLSSCRAARNSATPRTANYCFRAFAWRWARRNEPDPPSCRDPRCRCRG